MHKTVNLQISSEEFTTQDAARQWLLSLQGQGWVCTVDEVIFVENFSNVIGIPLQADVALNDTTSVSLRFTQGVWRVWTYTESDEGPMEVRALDEGRIDKTGSLST